MTTVSAIVKYAEVGLADRPLCHCERCNGQDRKRWQADGRRSTGGYWRCRGSERIESMSEEQAERRRASWRVYERNRYDSDAIYRIGKGVKKSIREREKRIDARRANGFVPNPAIQASLDREVLAPLLERFEGLGLIDFKTNA